MLNNCEAKGLGCVLTLPIYRGREQHGNGREAGDKGTGSGRVRYGRREVLTPLSPPTFLFMPFRFRVSVARIQADFLLVLASCFYISQSQLLKKR